MRDETTDGGTKAKVEEITLLPMIPVQLYNVVPVYCKTILCAVHILMMRLVGQKYFMIMVKNSARPLGLFTMTPQFKFQRIRQALLRF